MTGVRFAWSSLVAFVLQNAVHGRVAAAMAFTVVACSQEAMLERFASKDAQAAARARIEQLRSRDFDALEKDIDPTLRGPGLRSTLEKMAALIPAGQPSSVKLVGAHQFSGPDAHTTNLNFEYGFDNRWLLINVAMREKGGVTTLVGMHVSPIAGPLEEQSRFSLRDKTPTHYAVLASAVVVVLLTVYALIACIRTPMPRRKWAWILFILVGIGKLGVDWSTGEVSVMPLSVQIFSASAMAAFPGPWMVAVSLPLGAIVFLLRRRRDFADNRPAMPTPATTKEPSP